MSPSRSLAQQGHLRGMQSSCGTLSWPVRFLSLLCLPRPACLVKKRYQQPRSAWSWTHLAQTSLARAVAQNTLSNLRNEACTVWHSSTVKREMPSDQRQMRRPRKWLALSAPPRTAANARPMLPQQVPPPAGKTVCRVPSPEDHAITVAL